MQICGWTEGDGRRRSCDANIVCFVCSFEDVVINIRLDDDAEGTGKINVDRAVDGSSVGLVGCKTFGSRK